MSQSRFDHSSLIINVVFAMRCSWSHCSGLCCTNTSELALTSTPDGKAAAPFPHHPVPPHPNPPLPQLTLCPSVCLSASLSLFVPLCGSFESSRKGLIAAFAHLRAHTLTHTVDCRVSLQSDWNTVVGVCHSFIIDQIQLPSSTDHLEKYPVIRLLSSWIPNPFPSHYSFNNSTLYAQDKEQFTLAL